MHEPSAVLISSNAVSLPVELYRPIIEKLGTASQLEKSTLCALALSCHTLRDEAQRVLFSVPYIPTHSNREIYNHLNLLQAIAESPDRLALLVTQYSQICVTHRPALESPQQNSIQELRDATARGLRVMVNLRVLEYCCFDAKNGIPPTNLLHGCQFHLEELSWACDDKASQVALLRDFLPTQKRLKTLCLAGVFMENFNWQATAYCHIPRPPTPPCPRIIALSGPWGVLDMFLPGSSVRYLEWFVPEGCEDYFLAPGPLTTEIKNALGRVEHFSYHSRYGPPHTKRLSLLYQSLRSLRCLEILSYELDDESVRLLPEDYHLLGKLPLLTQFGLFFKERWPMSNVPMSDGFALQVADSAFGHCKLLRRVEVGIDEDQFIRFLSLPDGRVRQTKITSWDYIHDWRARCPESSISRVPFSLLCER